MAQLGMVCSAFTGTFFRCHMSVWMNQYKCTSNETLFAFNFQNVLKCIFCEASNFLFDGKAIYQESEGDTAAAAKKGRLM